MSKPDRNDVLDTIKTKFEPRIVAWMNALRDALTKIGATCGKVEETTGDCYKWSLGVSFVGNNDETPRKMAVGVDIGFDFEITEAIEHDGDEDGINFMFRGVYWGGRVFGLSIEPGNYTPACWVDMNDAEAVEQRFRLVETSNTADGMAEAIKDEWSEGRAA